DPAAVRAQAMAAADTYTTVCAQAMDELVKKTTRPEVIEWALQQRISSAIASFTNATGSNDYVALLDMLVFATLKRHAVEEHWIPNLLHEEGAPVLEAFRRGETDVWAIGGKSLSSAQLDQLRVIIDQWRRDNPAQYYVSHIRFTDFATSMNVGAGSPHVKMPGNVFGLLYIDPLANLDPVTRELRDYRALTERIVFLVNRMPIVLSWQLDFITQRATSGPQIVAFVESTARFADSTKQFAEAAARVADATKETADAVTRTADAIVKVPDDLAVERKAAIEQVDVVVAAQSKAAIDQVMAGVTAQREAVARDLDAQEGRLRQLVADVKGVVERADQAGLSINTATGQTITTTEQATQRTLRLAFRLGLILIIVALVGIPLSLLLYRIAARRWAAPAQRTTSP
ncbi:MAG: hypothetical protein WBD40_24770, partial [Tepidisphaeraceae bacterium]